MAQELVSGQSNYLGKVKTHKMSENEMGYRRSKSVLTYTLGSSAISTASVRAQLDSHTRTNSVLVKEPS